MTTPNSSLNITTASRTPIFLRIGLTVLPFIFLTSVWLVWFGKVKLGSFPEIIFLSEALVIFLLSPVLICCQQNLIGSNSLICLPRHQWCRFLIDLLGKRLIGLWCAICISSLIWLIVNWTTDVLTILSFRVLFLHLTLAIFAFTGGVSGIFGQYLFRSHQQMRFVYAVQLAIVWWGFLILSPFFLIPLDRYLTDLQPVIPYFLHLNPLVAICQLLEHDIFRTPYLYRILPVASYHFVYPPWWVICGWQILLAVGILWFIEQNNEQDVGQLKLK